ARSAVVRGQEGPLEAGGEAGAAAAAQARGLDGLDDVARGHGEGLGQTLVAPTGPVGVQGPGALGVPGVGQDRRQLGRAHCLPSSAVAPSPAGPRLPAGSVSSGVVGGRSALPYGSGTSVVASTAPPSPSVPGARQPCSRAMLSPA